MSFSSKRINPNQVLVSFVDGRYEMMTNDEHEAFSEQIQNTLNETEIQSNNTEI